MSPSEVVAQWRKSTYSGTNMNCVECTSAAWHVSTRSGPNANCVETVTHFTAVAVRDSKHPHLPHLTFPAPAWAALVGAVRTGEL